MHALCLSGGGMFGAYQAGVWQELSRVWKPDLVVGTSIGAVNGYAIASGMPADQLVARWLHLPALARHHLQVPFPPRQGVVAHGPLEQLVRDLHAGLQPRLPLGIVATRWRGFQPQLFQGGEVTSDHLLAACALPVVLPQYKLDGRWYADGGLISALPIWAAIEMGATHIVAVNVIPRMPWFVRWPLLGLKRMKGGRRGLKRDAVVVTIKPEPPLGGWKEAAWWSRPRAERYVERGCKDAREVWSRIS